MSRPDRIRAVPLIAKKAISKVVMWEEESPNDAEPYSAMANPNTWWWVRLWQGEREGGRGRIRYNGQMTSAWIAFPKKKKKKTVGQPTTFANA